eukprot:102016-Pyramimonas_sp.AAC.1
MFSHLSNSCVKKDVIGMSPRAPAARRSGASLLAGKVVVVGRCRIAGHHHPTVKVPPVDGLERPRCTLLVLMMSMAPPRTKQRSVPITTNMSQWANRIRLQGVWRGLEGVWRGSGGGYIVA